MTVQTGLARLAGEGSSLLEGRRLGLLVNATAVDAQLRHAIDLLGARSDLKITTLFGPEHGIRGDAQDMIAVDQARDPSSDLPVHSLYGATAASLSPTPAMLDDIDVMVYDVQDVGSRYYTFVWTMVLAMRACAAAGKAFCVLDRPNPLGGLHVEGPMIARTSSSSTSCLAKERAFSALPCESFMTSSIFLPAIPPAAFASSASICRVLDSGRPRLAAGPVIANIAPILMAPVSAAKPDAVRSAQRHRQRESFFLDMTFSLEMRELNNYT